MKRVYKLIRHKRNVRRLLALAFVLIMFIEVGSQAILDNQDPNSANASAWCNILHHLSPSADCPHKRHDSAPQSNPFGDVTHYWAALGEFTLPVADIVYDTPPIAHSTATPLSRAITPPFLPPKQA
jgi:hypothetical protein